MCGGGALSKKVPTSKILSPYIKIILNGTLSDTGTKCCHVTINVILYDIGCRCYTCTFVLLDYSTATKGVNNLDASLGKLMKKQMFNLIGVESLTRRSSPTLTGRTCENLE